LDGSVGEARQDSAQVITHWDLQAAAALDDGKDRSYAWSSLLASQVDPVFPANRDRTHRVLSEVVAEFYLRIIQETCQLLPRRESVAARFACGALRQHALARRQDMGANLNQQWTRVLLTQRVARGVIHLLLARLGIDGEQLIHQRHNPRRGNILPVELHRIEKLPPRVSPACSVHHLRPTDTVVGCVVISL
jgi:hypothetical protein